MKHFALALLGFGNVGKALAQLLLRKSDELKERYNLTFAVTGIYTSRHGAAIDPDGIDLLNALEMNNLTRLSKLPAPINGIDFIQRSGADILFENSPVNYNTGQPAVEHIQTALKSGMHAITANKGPVVHAYHALTSLAETNGRRFFFESAVMDGCPIFSLFRTSLPAAQLSRFRGVLNSTTNLILTRMESGESFDQAVAYCQQIGIAETDPSGDIDGWDASVKVAALATVLMDTPIKPQQVERKGIRHIGPSEVRRALQEGKRWKLICTAERSQSGIIAKVNPELVSIDSPMYGVEGTTSIIQFETDVLGKLTILEENPGPETTAYGCLSDFISAVSQ
jgi:homoserine dehydrogenase